MLIKSRFFTRRKPVTPSIGQIFSDDAHQTCGTKAAGEFFGEITAIEGRQQITGTFLSNDGRYCVVKLMSPETDIWQVTSPSRKRLGAVFKPELESPEEVALPRLLGSPTRQGKKEGQPSFFMSARQEELNEA